MLHLWRAIFNIHDAEREGDIKRGRTWIWIGYTFWESTDYVTDICSAWRCPFLFRKKTNSMIASTLMHQPVSTPSTHKWHKWNTQNAVWPRCIMGLVKFQMLKCSRWILQPWFTTFPTLLMNFIAPNFTEVWGLSAVFDNSCHIAIAAEWTGYYMKWE